jgi:hypothetical protein
MDTASRLVPRSALRARAASARTTITGMDLETAQRIERLEYVVGVLCRHLELNPDLLLGTQTGAAPIADAIPPGYPAPAQPGRPGLPAEFYALIQRGKKIEAIKMYRQLTGVGLKEAKDFVDSCG